MTNDDVPCPMIAKLDAWSKARRGRVEGQYWVQTRNGQPEVAWWQNCIWWRQGHERGFADSRFATIDERRILPPDHNP